MPVLAPPGRLRRWLTLYSIRVNLLSRGPALILSQWEQKLCSFCYNTKVTRENPMKCKSTPMLPVKSSQRPFMLKTIRKQKSRTIKKSNVNSCICEHHFSMTKFSRNYLYQDLRSSIQRLGILWDMFQMMVCGQQFHLATTKKFVNVHNGSQENMQ